MKGIVYNANEQGIWEGKTGSHSPVITVTGRKIEVETKHGMEEKHFIVRHTVVLKDGTLLGGRTFTAADKPLSDYELPEGYTGSITATSYCNMHDLWISSTEIA